MGLLMCALRRQIALLAVYVQRFHRKLLSVGYLSFNRETSVFRHAPIIAASVGPCLHSAWCMRTVAEMSRAGRVCACCLRQ
jgi:hypothetical protein